MWQSCAEPWDRDLALPADGEVDGAQTILWSQKPRAEPGAGVRWQCCTEGHGKWGCRRKQGWGQEGGCGLLGTRGQARAGREGLGPACCWQ